jgi:cyclic lactone autoinducer peptide
MKNFLAKRANAFLLVAAAVIATTDSIIWHQPEVPKELFKK